MALTVSINVCNRFRPAQKSPCTVARNTDNPHNWCDGCCLSVLMSHPSSQDADDIRERFEQLRVQALYREESN